MDTGKPARRVYFIGIKGTGMAALAELMHSRGVQVSGSDGPAVFYTDAILKDLGIPFHESFDAAHIRDDVDLFVHSAAYSPDTNPEMAEAVRRGLTLRKYTDALGDYSALFDSSGVAGVHGKTTTTALAGSLIRGACLPAQVLVGSSAFGGRCTLNQGDKYFIAETCEYRRHFLSFRPRRIVLTSVESDHQDFFPTFESIRDAFLDYCRLLPPDGELIYCADDPGASGVAEKIAAERPGLTLTPYGFNAAGDFRLTSCKAENERLLFTVQGFPGEWRLRVPGRHNALNAAGALALVTSLVKKEAGGWDGPRLDAARASLEEFRGSSRRSEILGEKGGVLFMDDYGHHPTAIAATLAGFREFFPARRLVVSFMSHTYTRTAALLDEFAACFDAADVLVLHKIYASAREVYKGGVDGRTLFEKAREHIKSVDSKTDVHYVEEPLDAAALLKETLRPGDLFVTMGAGDNWPLGRLLFEQLEKK